LPVDAEADDDRRALRHQCERHEVAQVELPVGVGERHAAEPRRLEAGPQRRPVAAVDAQADQPHARPTRGDCFDGRRGAVGAAVIDDEDFVLLESRSQHVVGLGDGEGDALDLVVGGQNERQRQGDEGRVHAGSPASRGAMPRKATTDTTPP